MKHVEVKITKGRYKGATFTFKGKPSDGNMWITNSSVPYMTLRLCNSKTDGGWYAERQYKHPSSKYGESFLIATHLPSAKTAYNFGCNFMWGE